MLSIVQTMDQPARKQTAGQASEQKVLAGFAYDFRQD